MSFEYDKRITENFGLGVNDGWSIFRRITRKPRWDISLAALIPGNKATGTHVGAIAQFHIFLDDVFPNSIGKPLF